VFIGSCTNSRIEDLRVAADVARGPQGQERVAHASSSGLGRGQGPKPSPRVSTGLFVDAGFDWREPGCSMCLAMIPTSSLGRALRIDVEPQFRRRQGKGGRTHLVSPAVAAATRSPVASRRRKTELMEKVNVITGAECRWCVPTSTPNQIHPSDWLSASSRTGSVKDCSRVARELDFVLKPGAATGRQPSSWPARTSATAVP